MGDTALPIVAITMGDAAGVGPEVVIKAVQEQSVAGVCRRLVIGSVDVLARVSQMLGVELALHKVIDAAGARFEEGTVDVLDPGGFNIADLTPGKLCPPAGKAAAEYVLLAGRLALDGIVDAIATAPLNKEAMREGGYHYIGHTEILAELTGTPRCTTMLASGPLRVVHVTRHMPLAQVAGHITRERVLETIRITYEGMGQLGFARPRLGVAALNPHGGEGGLLGSEEGDAIAPAVADAQAEGIAASGPLPADSIFFRAIRGEFDAVVAMYHDQGHIPIKVYGFEKSVTVTLGLPIVRTSVDHGTAFDIAWQGIADPTSMIEAIKMAAQMAHGKDRGRGQKY